MRSAQPANPRGDVRAEPAIAYPSRFAEFWRAFARNRGATTSAASASTTSTPTSSSAISNWRRRSGRRTAALAFRSAPTPSAATSCRG